jgi:hypothetical protein
VQYLAAPQHHEGGRARGLTAPSREPVDCACWYSTVRHKIAVVAVTPASCFDPLLKHEKDDKLVSFMIFGQVSGHVFARRGDRHSILRGGLGIAGADLRLPLRMANCGTRGLETVMLRFSIFRFLVCGWDVGDLRCPRVKRCGDRGNEKVLLYRSWSWSYRSLRCKPIR